MLLISILLSSQLQPMSAKVQLSERLNEEKKMIPLNCNVGKIVKNIVATWRTNCSIPDKLKLDWRLKAVIIKLMLKYFELLLEVVTKQCKSLLKA